MSRIPKARSRGVRGDVEMDCVPENDSLSESFQSLSLRPRSTALPSAQHSHGCHGNHTEAPQPYRTYAAPLSALPFERVDENDEVTEFLSCGKSPGFESKLWHSKAHDHFKPVGSHRDSSDCEEYWIENSSYKDFRNNRGQIHTAETCNSVQTNLNRAGHPEQRRQTPQFSHSKAHNHPAQPRHLPGTPMTTHSRTLPIDSGQISATRTASAQEEQTSRRARLPLGHLRDVGYVVDKALKVNTRHDSTTHTDGCLDNETVLLNAQNDETQVMTSCLTSGTSTATTTNRHSTTDLGYESASNQYSNTDLEFNCASNQYQNTSSQTNNRSIRYSNADSGYCSAGNPCSNKDSEYDGGFNRYSNTDSQYDSAFASQSSINDRPSGQHYKRIINIRKSDSQRNKWHDLTIGNVEYEFANAYDIEIFFKPDEDGDSIISLAIIHEREDVVLAILDKVKDQTSLDIPNRERHTLLHLATILNMPKVVRRLVALGAHVIAQNCHGNTALHIACVKGHLECAKSLTKPIQRQEVQYRSYYTPFQRIPQKQDILNYDGFACLHLAAQHGHVNIIDHLLYECGADVNIQDGTSGMTILHYAAIENNAALVSFLLNIRGIDINAMRFDSSTPLAIARGRNNQVQVLLQNNNAVDYDHADDSDCSDDEDGDIVMIDYGYRTETHCYANNAYDDIQINVW